MNPEYMELRELIGTVQDLSWNWNGTYQGIQILKTKY